MAASPDINLTVFPNDLLIIFLHLMFINPLLLAGFLFLPF